MQQGNFASIYDVNYHFTCMYSLILLSSFWGPLYTSFDIFHFTIEC